MEPNRKARARTTIRAAQKPYLYHFRILLILRARA